MINLVSKLCTRFQNVLHGCSTEKQKGLTFKLIPFVFIGVPESIRTPGPFLRRECQQNIFDLEVAQEVAQNKKGTYELG